MELNKDNFDKDKKKAIEWRTKTLLDKYEDHEIEKIICHELEDNGVTSEDNILMIEEAIQEGREREE